MRETSLWERHFEKYGKQKDWEKKISEVHKIRNKVAHQKTITIEEFTDTNRKLNAINRNLSNAIEGIREENFTENSIVDILGSFAILAGSKVKNIAQSQAFKDVVIGFSAKIQEMLKPMEEIYDFGAGHYGSKKNPMVSLICPPISKESKSIWVERSAYIRSFIHDKSAFRLPRQHLQEPHG